MRDATIEIVKEVINHPNADRLDICTVLGYKCVTKRDQFKVGDKVVYVRPDSVFPDSEWAQEYKKYSQKRVKAVKLRDFWSEGVIIPFSALPEVTAEAAKDCLVGDDVSELLWISHYEPPAPTDLSAKGGLPYGIPMTDEERCLSKGTIIKTDIGDLPIEYICENKLEINVLSYDVIKKQIGYKKIINHIIKNNNNDWYKITLENGETIIVTGNHRIYLPELNCYREANLLKINDILYTNY